MVDFNNETTVTTPAVDVVRILILQRRNDVIEAFEHYNKLSSSDVEVDLSIIKSRLHSLYLELQGLADKRMDDTDMDKMTRSIFDCKTSDDLLKIFSKFNVLLYEINLTKIDNKPDYDTTDTELENKLNRL